MVKEGNISLFCSCFQLCSSSSVSQFCLSEQRGLNSQELIGGASRKLSNDQRGKMSRKQHQGPTAGPLRCVLGS